MAAGCYLPGGKVVRVACERLAEVIRIGSIKAGDTGEYCGRPNRSRSGSPLANPYPLPDESQRDAVCEKYRTWFDNQLRLRSPRFIAELDRLEKIARAGDLTLLCWCRDLAGAVPESKKCHCDVIRERIEQ